ncbi:hypothetical protein C1H46_026880 [Malus baccata]|uniref:Uncharacterized protein n=1 Tax=Malus baccata TaxID=106549 RepID=A0A540LM74_MALBA|nr:hypothetical protein C1H46_026880 [Malus baccata]
MAASMISNLDGSLDASSIESSRKKPEKKPESWKRIGIGAKKPEFDGDQRRSNGSTRRSSRRRFVRCDRDRLHHRRRQWLSGEGQGQYAWDQHRASSERQLVGPARLERRGYSKSESPENIDELDLRHRLSKHRRVNGLRSIVSHDYAVDGHVEERNNRPLRDSQQLPPHDYILHSIQNWRNHHRYTSSRLYGWAGATYGLEVAHQNGVHGQAGVVSDDMNGPIHNERHSPSQQTVSLIMSSNEQQPRHRLVLVLLCSTPALPSPHRLQATGTTVAAVRLLPQRAAPSSAAFHPMQ